MSSNAIAMSMPMATSMPMVIKNKINQYSLSTIAFDPPQNSPPSLWKIRLNKRIYGIENPLKTSVKTL